VQPASTRCGTPFTGPASWNFGTDLCGSWSTPYCRTVQHSFYPRQFSTRVSRWFEIGLRLNRCRGEMRLEACDLTTKSTASRPFGVALSPNGESSISGRPQEGLQSGKPKKSLGLKPHSPTHRLGHTSRNSCQASGYSRAVFLFCCMEA